MEKWWLNVCITKLALIRACCSCRDIKSNYINSIETKIPVVVDINTVEDNDGNFIDNGLREKKKFVVNFDEPLQIDNISDVYLDGWYIYFLIYITYQIF